VERVPVLKLGDLLLVSIRTDTEDMELLAARRSAGSPDAGPGAGAEASPVPAP
jgi:hypothetical protein